MLNVINIFTFIVTSSELKSKLSNQDTHLLAIILELLIGLGHLTLRKTKQPIIQVWSKQKQNQYMSGFFLTYYTKVVEIFFSPGL